MSDGEPEVGTRHAVPEIAQAWDRLGDKTVHSWTARGRGSREGPLVVVLPGLGLPAYAAPTVRTLAARGATCVLLDLPGFGERGLLGAGTDIHSIGRMAARWIVRGGHQSSRVVVVGHSTGAQAALTTALALQGERPDVELVMAGPTFIPPHRRLGPLLLATPRAYREDTFRELRVLPAVARGRLGVWHILRSGMADAPERRITDLRLGVTLTSGRSDAFAPGWWLRMLAASARSAAYAVVAPVPGSHNNLFTHPAELADVILGSAVSGARGSDPP